MADLNRTDLIALLERLGAQNDATVLEAARALHRQVSETGSSWDDLLRRDLGLTDPLTDADSHERDETAADDAAPETDGAPPTADLAETARLVDRLLARKNISNTLRADLNELKENISDGSLDAMDSRYIRALAKRLGV